MKNNSQNQPIFLDYNATSPIRKTALKAMHSALSEPLNPSSIHHFGRKGQSLIEQARESLAAHIGIPAPQIIFNSGATEGNNTVLNQFKEETILVSAIEHPSVLEAAPNAVKIPVTKDGIIDLGVLEELLKSEKPALVSIMVVNNETGAVQPIKEASALIHRHNALLHCDGVQALGKTPLNMQALGIDFLTLSSHKIGGSQGVGALALGLCGITPTLLHGGGQEKSARPGTHNTAGIAAFGAALEEATQNLDAETARLKILQTKLENTLKDIEGITIHSQNATRVPNTTLFSLQGGNSQTMLMALDLEGLCISNGSACSSGSVKPSHVLSAMNINEETNAATLRISTGWNTMESDIDYFIERFAKLAQRLKT